MAAVTLKSLHIYLRLLENAAELKRRIPASTNPRTLKEGLMELSRLASVDESVFKDPPLIAALIGAPRFVMIRGEPSATDQVALVFDSSRVLLTVLVSPAHAENPTVGQIGAGHQQGGAMAARAAGWIHPKSAPFAPVQVNAEQEAPLGNLKSLLAGNAILTCRLFRVLFEHMLGFASGASTQQGSASLVNDLTGSREHSRSFVSTALFVLGEEVDRDNLISFMMQQGLFGMSVIEHLLQKRDYCDAYLSFRHLERAFMGPPAVEEAQLRNRLDQFNAQFGGKPHDAKLLEADEQDKAKIDAHQAAIDLLEAMALTPWRLSLSQAVSRATSNSIRSVSTIAHHFELFSRGQATKERANQEIADHLFAFAQQFLADTKPA